MATGRSDVIAAIAGFYKKKNKNTFCVGGCSENVKNKYASGEMQSLDLLIS